MAAAAVNSEIIRHVEECSICLLNLIDPKILKCNHHFCKNCLENILVFEEGGCATITCPVDECAHQTLLNVDKTVNELKTYQLEETVEEAVKAENDQVCTQIPRCTYVGGCENAISLYCCGQTMCQSCSVKHQSSQAQHERKITLFFCKRENKLKGLCEKHHSPFTHLCNCDNIFLCVYCLHRNLQHKQHVKNTIEAEGKMLREALIDDFNNKEKLQACRKATEEKIPLTKERLDAILEQRKEECLAQYMAYLNAEEEKIKSKFDDICCHVRRIAELSLHEDTL